MGKKLSYNKVKEYFKSHDCELLSTSYSSYKSKLKYRCHCGNVVYKSLDKFKKYHNCPNCRKITYKEVFEYFKSHECTLLSKEYINTYSKLKYVCHCGRKSNISFHNFKKGQRCYECSKEKKRNSYTKIYIYFKKHDCTLLSKEYINVNKKLKYQCECGNISEITFNKFQAGQRCNKCQSERIKKTRIKNGYWLSDREFSEFEIYRKITDKLSGKNYRKYKKIINPENLPRGRGKYHLDHKFSVLEGFNNNIPPFIISNINNLQMLTEHDNISKGNKCSITLEELFNIFKTQLHQS